MGGGSPECPVCRVLKLGILDAIIRQAEVQKLPGRAPELLRVRAEAGLERNGAEGKYHAHARSHQLAAEAAVAVHDPMLAIQQVGELLLAALEAEAEAGRLRSARPDAAAAFQRWVECRKASKELEREYEALVRTQEFHFRSPDTALNSNRLAAQC
jgi:hypothetical protein